MADIYTALLSDAQDTANRMLQDARHAAAEREQIAIHSARVVFLPVGQTLY